MASLNHLHCYKRVKFGKSFVFRCTKEGCGHFLHPQFIDGRMAECPFCHSEFRIGSREKRMKYPHCEVCRERMREKYRGVVEEKEISKVRTADELVSMFKDKFGD